MKQELIDLVNALLWFYVLPTTISVLFAIIHRKENPFRKDSETREYVFAPVANIMIACVIVFLFVPRETYWAIKKRIRKFVSWTKKVL